MNPQSPPKLVVLSRECSNKPRGTSRIICCFSFSGSFHFSFPASLAAACKMEPPMPLRGSCAIASRSSLRMAWQELSLRQLWRVDEALRHGPAQSHSVPPESISFGEKHQLRSMSWDSMQNLGNGLGKGTESSRSQVIHGFVATKNPSAAYGLSALYLQVHWPCKAHLVLDSIPHTAWRPMPAKSHRQRQNCALRGASAAKSREVPNEYMGCVSK